jgi:hypothetical protein
VQPNWLVKLTQEGFPFCSLRFASAQLTVGYKGFPVRQAKVEQSPAARVGFKYLQSRPAKR